VTWNDQSGCQMDLASLALGLKVLLYEVTIWIEVLWK
jgi:hypothetical protein